MVSSLSVVERYARYLMGVVTVLGVMAALALRVGLISKAPFYNEHLWYLESSHSTFIVISEYADENECRQHQKEFMTCRSGKSLSEEIREREGKQRG